MKKLITERDILAASKERRSRLQAAAETIVTPAAKDAARTRKIAIVKPASTLESLTISTPRQQNSKIQAIVMGCDHGGFDLKIMLREFVEDMGYVTEDVGTFSTESVDYPDYAHLVAQKIAKNQMMVGVIIDGAGVGSAMTANKVPGVRAAACYDVYTAANSREHNYANVLTLGSRVTGIDIAKQILKVWLETDYGAERHKRRVDKIMQVEKKYASS